MGVEQPVAGGSLGLLRGVHQLVQGLLGGQQSVVGLPQLGRRRGRPLIQGLLGFGYGLLGRVQLDPGAVDGQAQSVQVRRGGEGAGARMNPHLGASPVLLGLGVGLGGPLPGPLGIRYRLFGGGVIVGDLGLRRLPGLGGRGHRRPGPANLAGGRF